MRAGDQAVNLANDSSGNGRHNLNLPQRGLRESKPGKQLRQVDVLHLQRSPPRELAVQMLPSRRERLVQSGPLRPQPLGVRAAQAIEKLPVKGVAISGDFRQERAESRRRIVCLRAAAARARRHENDPGQHGRGLEEQFVAWQRVGRLDPFEDRVERDLLQHESPVSPLPIEMMRIPLAEVIVRPLVYRMIEIVSPRIEGQLVEQIGIEPGGVEQPAIGASQQIERQCDDLPIPSSRDARPGDIERDRADPLVRIRLDPLRRMEHGHRAMADKIVQPREGPGDDPFRFIPRRAFRQHGLHHAADEKRPPEIAVGEMKEQIAMMLAIGRQDVVEYQPQHCPRLFRIGERGRFAGQLRELADQSAIENQGRLLRWRPFRLDLLDELIEITEHARIGRARREIQIPQHLRPDFRTIRGGVVFCHRSNLRRHRRGEKSSLRDSFGMARNTRPPKLL